MSEVNLNMINDPNILLLTVPQVQNITQLGKTKIYEIVNSENCPFTVHRFGTTIRIEKESLVKFLKQPH